MSEKAGKMLSIKEVAKFLNLSEPRVKQMIYRNELNAEKVGNQWVIFESDLESVKDRRAVGRPAKEAKASK